jgi:hypothetical protein
VLPYLENDITMGNEGLEAVEARIAKPSISTGVAIRVNPDPEL